MIEAPQSQDIRLPATAAAPSGPSKASMMIAAYRAARLNQRFTLRTASMPQQALMPPTAPEHRETGCSPPEETFVTATAYETDGTNQTDPPASEPEAVHLGPAHKAGTAPEPAPGEGAAADRHDLARSEPALARIGLGPSMLLRLSQIGLNSVHDIAQANPEDLRAALGGSSRLLNVEAWISNARHLTATSHAA